MECCPLLMGVFLSLSLSFTHFPTQPRRQPLLTHPKRHVTLSHWPLGQCKCVKLSVLIRAHSWSIHRSSKYCHSFLPLHLSRVLRITTVRFSYRSETKRQNELHIIKLLWQFMLNISIVSFSCNEMARWILLAVEWVF